MSKIECGECMFDNCEEIAVVALGLSVKNADKQGILMSSLGLCEAHFLDDSLSRIANDVGDAMILHLTQCGFSSDVVNADIDLIGVLIDDMEKFRDEASKWGKHYDLINMSAPNVRNN